MNVGFFYHGIIKSMFSMNISEFTFNNEKKKNFDEVVFILHSANTLISDPVRLATSAEE